MANARPSRISGNKILRDLRLAGRKGDRSALAIALDSMRTLAHTPRYWEKYLALLRNPSARLVDLLVIKQGDKIAHQKGWKTRRAAPSPTDAGVKRRGRSARGKRARAPRRSEAAGTQQSLFD